MRGNRHGRFGRRPGKDQPTLATRPMAYLATLRRPVPHTAEYTHIARESLPKVGTHWVNRPNSTGSPPSWPPCPAGCRSCCGNWAAGWTPNITPAGSGRTTRPGPARIVARAADDLASGRAGRARTGVAARSMRAHQHLAHLGATEPDRTASARHRHGRHLRPPTPKQKRCRAPALSRPPARFS